MKQDTLIWFGEVAVRDSELHLSGEYVEPGVYRDLKTNQEVAIDKAGILPAIDGHIGCFVHLSALPIPVVQALTAGQSKPAKKKCTGSCEACRRRREQEITTA